MSGVLVLVATPIGNLADMTFRAVDVLKSADVIACEDTRHTRKLLNHYEIKGVPLIAVHEHNEEGEAQKIVERIAAGETVALVTDAGMPAVSDPGERVVRRVAEAGLTVTVIPGASASVSALAISGLPTAQFTFLGFLDRKGSMRQTQLQRIASSSFTTILYEAPQRIVATLRELQQTCGDERAVTLVRELTKLHETVERGTVAELVARLADTTLKGECVLVVAPAPPQADIDDEAIRAALAVATAAGMTKRDAVRSVSDTLTVPKNRVYDLASS